MVMKMNKRDVIDKLKEELNYDEERCLAIDNIYEENFIFGKTNKEKVIEKFVIKLNMDNNEAEHVYEVMSSIVTEGIKNSILHPFKKKD